MKSIAGHDWRRDTSEFSDLNRLLEQPIHEVYKTLPERLLFAVFWQNAKEIASQYEAREFGKALKAVMGLADVANQYIADKRPWDVAKDKERLDELNEICLVALNLFHLLTIYLKPVLRS